MSSDLWYACPWSLFVWPIPHDNVDALVALKLVRYLYHVVYQLTMTFI